MICYSNKGLTYADGMPHLIFLKQKLNRIIKQEVKLCCLFHNFKVTYSCLSTLESSIKRICLLIPK